MAEICGFQVLRTLRNRTLFLDDRARERHALAALGLAAKRTIGLAGAACAAACGFTDIPFTNGIADADDHGNSLAFAMPRANANCSQGLMSITRKKNHAVAIAPPRIGWRRSRASERHSHSSGP